MRNIGKINKNLFVLLVCAPLIGGCGASVGRNYVANDKDLVISDFEQIKVGMRESEVVSILGLPGSYGIDEDGRFFLHYMEVSSTVVAGNLGTGIAGSTTTNGFEGWVYFNNGKSIDMKVKQWQ